LALGLVLTLGMAAAGCEGDPNEPQTWIKKLRDVRPLPGGKGTVQEEAIRNLRRINNKAALPALIELYKDPRGSRAPEVIEAIIQFHDPASAPLLISTLDYSETDFDAATKAAAELGALKSHEAVPGLIKTLEKPLPIKSRANLVKWEAIRALAKIKDPQALAPLCKVVKALPDEQDIFLNKVAALALGEYGDPKGVPCLLYGAFISRADGATFFPEVRIALAKIGEPAVQPIIDLLQEKNTEVAELGKKLDFKPGVMGFKAALLLGDLRAKQAVPALIAKAREPVRGDDSSAQGNALVALGKIGEPAGMDYALGVLRDGHAKAELRQSACDAVFAARDLRALPTLLSIAKEKGAAANLRVAAAIALGRLGGKAEYEAFAPVAKAEGYDEFKEVVERLEVAKECSGAMIDCWIKALDSKKLTHQEKAAVMLGAEKDKQRALKALVAHLDTQVAVVRLAVVDSIRRLADRSCKECQDKLDTLIKREEKLTSKLPQYKQMVDEMSVTLAALTR
jgi:HEAT repeat protein